MKKTLHMWRKLRFGFSLKINWTLAKMSDKNSLSIQVKEILMKQIMTYPCLYGKSKMLYKKRDINRNAWCIKLQKSWISYKTVHTYVDMKNLLCISSGKEWKIQGKSFCRKNTLSEMYVIFWKELGHHCQKMFKSFRRHSEVPKNQEWRIFIVLT